MEEPFWPKVNNLDGYPDIYLEIIAVIVLEENICACITMLV